MRWFALWLLAMSVSSSAWATLNVLACEPEWAALIREIAGDRVRVTSATTALQDPHHIEARPALIAQARRADLLVCTGADLEAGWLPLLQRESANPAIQVGQPGWFEAARWVRLIEKPLSVDRAQGDVHPAGNPHLHLDPRNLLPVADALAQRLATLDPDGAARYEAGRADFSRRLKRALAGWEQQALRLKGTPVLVQHKTWSYLVAWLGLAVVADLEPQPGVEPSAAHLARLLTRLRTQPARMLLRAAYVSPRGGDWLAEKSAVRVVSLPYTVGGSERTRDLIGFYGDIIDRLTETEVGNEKEKEAVR
ncbi:MAG: zinc ABC transporter substrate-binding protein [Sterolibacterium sp.]|jgi:zinc/manganese transport system substrate-binding protein|nr:zinc ABC transporter substrate-binding protein [Sterolibacterium sp.]